jgi:hypothetical protein
VIGQVGPAAQVARGARGEGADGQAQVAARIAQGHDAAQFGAVGEARTAAQAQVAEHRQVSHQEVMVVTLGQPGAAAAQAQGAREDQGVGRLVGAIRRIAGRTDHGQAKRRQDQRQGGHEDDEVAEMGAVQAAGPAAPT